MSSARSYHQSRIEIISPYKQHHTHGKHASPLDLSDETYDAANQILRTNLIKLLLDHPRSMNSTVWDQYTKQHIGSMEMVQRTAARFVFNSWNRHFHLVPTALGDRLCIKKLGSCLAGYNINPYVNFRRRFHVFN